MKRYLIIGVTSAVGEQVVCFLYPGEVSVFLTGRSLQRLETIGADLSIRGARRIITEHLELSKMQDLEGLVSRAATSLGGLDGIIYFAGLRSIGFSVIEGSGQPGNDVDERRAITAFFASSAFLAFSAAAFAS